MPHSITEIPAPTIKPQVLLSENFAQRLRAFGRSVVDTNPPLSEIWATIYKSYLLLLEPGLLSGSASRLNQVLLPRRFANVDQTWEASALAAAYSLGVIPVFNPDQAVPEVHPVQGLFDAMECVTLSRITHPGIPGLDGVQIGQRFVPSKLLEAVATASGISLLEKTGTESFLELGAGLGFLSYWLSRIFPRAKCHIVDLPFMAMIQASYLALGTSEETIWMEGEPMQPGQKFFIHGSTLPQGLTFDFAVNQNSMPEMVPEESKRLLAYVADTLKPGGRFYSFNHESPRGGQTRVFVSAQGIPELKLVQRSPAWHSHHYLQEVFQRL